MHLLPYRPGCTSSPPRTWGNVPLRNSTCSKLWWWLENRWDLKAFDQWTGFHFTDLKTTSEAWTLERGVVLYATRFVSKGELFDLDHFAKASPDLSSHIQASLGTQIQQRLWIPFIFLDLSCEFILMINLRAKFSFVYNLPVRRQVQFCTWILIPSDPGKFVIRNIKHGSCVVQLSTDQCLTVATCPRWGSCGWDSLIKKERSWGNSLLSNRPSTSIPGWIL